MIFNRFKEIEQLLFNLAMLRINNETQRCAIQLAEPMNMAVCHYHRIALRNKAVQPSLVSSP